MLFVKRKRNPDYPNKRIIAIKKSIELGKELQEDHPEIEELYKQGNSFFEIIRKLDITSEYNINPKLAKSSIHKAISGHKGTFGLEEYVGLIPDAYERDKLANDHNQINGSKQGHNLYKKGEGIHAQSIEEKKKLGFKSYKMKYGIHGRTHKQHSEDGLKGYNSCLGKKSFKERRKVGLKGVLKKGLTPWKIEGIPEIEYAHGLTFLPEYYWVEGLNKGRVNNKLIAHELNRVYHDCKGVRNAKAVSSYLYLYKKSLENLI